MTPRSQQAKEYFLQGYNCAQSVMLAFCDLLSMSPQQAAALSSSMGGGVARLRDVCGAVSAVALVLGGLYGYSGPETGSVKKEHYQRVRQVIERFQQENGHYVCRVLLGEEGQDSSPAPSARTATYYAKRPCGDYVESAARILEEYLIECRHPAFVKEGL